MTSFKVGDHFIKVRGRVARIVQLRDEYHDFVEDPSSFLVALKANKEVSGSLFTFIQRVSDRIPRFKYHQEWDSVAGLQLTTYEHWWKKQINDKTRNMVRKAGKKGVEIREVGFDDDLVSGISQIYNETPIRQGRRFPHFGKPVATVRNENGTFLDRSVFLGAYCGEELVGFLKLVHGAGVSHVMQIIAMISQRDKAPTNALLAAAVERCTTKGVPMLVYGSWSHRTMGEFKKHHGFEPVLVPRYYVPLNLVGDLLLRSGLHGRLLDKLPEAWRERLLAWRWKWNSYRTRKMGPARTTVT